jgi:hypothetical protein
MRMAYHLFAMLMAVAILPAQTFGGAPTTSIVVNGPGIPPEGITITGSWPGWVTFADINSGAVPEPAADLPRYVLAGYTAEGSKWYTVLYVWDRSSGRALVYLPGPSETEYYRVNYGNNIAYAQLAGKWYGVLNRGSFEGWADIVRRALPQTSRGGP